MGKSNFGVNVFVNCPFDDAYRSKYKAILFTVLDCGFNPRSADEIESGTEVRIEKIYRLISECRYGIHDISRVELDNHNLPRFNMPFELGIFLAAQRFGNKKQQTKECLVLDRLSYRYQIFLSDFKGQDIQSHRNSVLGAIQAIRNWLRARTPENITSHTIMARRFWRFTRALPVACETMETPLDATVLSYGDYIYLAKKWLEENRVN